MTAAPDLFAFADPRFPSWYLAPQSDIERRFVLFDRVNPQIYAALEADALRELAKGTNYIGIGKLCEELRFNQNVITRYGAASGNICASGLSKEQFKLNNNFRSLYARLIIHRHPELDGVIRLRGRREKGGTVA